MSYISRLENDLKEAQKAKKYAVDKREEALRQIKDLKDKLSEEMERGHRELTATLEKVNAYKQKAATTEKLIRQKEQENLAKTNELRILQAKVAQ